MSPLLKYQASEKASNGKDYHHWLVVPVKFLIDSIYIYYLDVVTLANKQQDQPDTHLATTLITINRPKVYRKQQQQ